MNQGPPKLAIIGGTGPLGSGLAARWAAAGFDVTIGSRDENKALEVARSIEAREWPHKLKGEGNLAAAAGADIVILTVPFRHQADTLNSIAPALAGKILVDTTVPLVPPNVAKVQLPSQGSAGLIAQSVLGESVRVVSAFQNVAAIHLQKEGPIDCDVLVSGNDPDACEAVIELAKAIGLRAWHAGPIANAAAAEAMTSVLIQINKANKCHAGIRISSLDQPNARTDVDGSSLQLVALPALPLVKEGDDLAALIGLGLRNAGLELQAGDVIVLAQKIVSKAEGRVQSLADIIPSLQAQRLADITGKDPRFVELVLSQSEEIVKAAPGVLIAAHRLGLVYANAGIDRSNLDNTDGVERCLLLPEDPNRSAARLADELATRHGVHVGVIINDSTGRAWRNGLVSAAIGSAGLEPLKDLRGEEDLFGRPLEITQVACADEIACAASILMGQGSEGRPAIFVRGLNVKDSAANASALIRPKEEDLFR